MMLPGVELKLAAYLKFFDKRRVVTGFLDFIFLLTVHLDIILVNDQLDLQFFIVFISCLYMFQATSAHHQEDQLVSIHHLV
jgi:hypothetical protein